MLTQNNYYEKKGLLSRSALVLMMKAPSVFLKKEKYFNYKPRFFEIGSLVDCLLTTPELYKKEYCEVQLEKKPTGKARDIIDFVYGTFGHKINKLSDFPNKLTKTEKNLVISYMNDLDYYMGRTATSRFASLKKSIKFYLKSLIDCKGKIPVPKSQKILADSIVKSISNDPYTKIVIRNKSDKTKIWLNQVPIAWKEDGILCKALLDTVIIDLVNYVIYPIDIKTSRYNPSLFVKSAAEHKYYLQAAFYKSAIDALVKGEALNEDYFDKKLIDLFKNNDFIIDNFYFVVETTNPDFIGSPIIYRCTDYDLEVGKFGVTKIQSFDTVTGRVEYNKRIPGYLDGLQDYKNYITTGNWKYKTQIQNDYNRIQSISLPCTDLNILSEL